MKISRVYTTETVVRHMPPALKQYLDEYCHDYNEIERYVWRERTDPCFHKKYRKESHFITHICEKYKLLKRTVNSINYEVKGRIRALQELKKTEMQQLIVRISAVENKISSLKEEINKAKPLTKENLLGEDQLQKYRTYKQKLYWKQNKLNQLKQRKNNLEYEINNNILKIGFGSKEMFRKQYHLKENGYRNHEQWYRDYVKQRDKNIFFLGSSDESYGNQMFQMVYDNVNHLYHCRLRKENLYCNDSEKYLSFDVRFKYLNEELGRILENRYTDHPVSYRFHKRNGKWYLQAIFTIDYDQYATVSDYGCIGLDYNDGFIEASETDMHGNLIHQSHYNLKRHGTGKPAESEIREVIAKITAEAEKKGKDIAIEDLNFKRTKAGTEKAGGKRGRKYNRMIHLFDYSRYKDTLRNSCHKRMVNLKLVNPYNTSKIGKKKYSDHKKLTVHQAASYVIARKGQGYKDILTK